MPYHLSHPIHSRTHPLPFKVSDDALIGILEYLDPASLWNACKALTRIRRVSREAPSLRYKLKLCLACMKDGPVSVRYVPMYKRAEFLTSFMQQWTLSHPGKEVSMSYHFPSVVGISGRFVYQIQNHGMFSQLRLCELPSSTRNQPATEHMPLQCPPIEHVAIDHAQNLVVCGHAYELNGQISLQVHFRNMLTQEPHHDAFEPMYDFATNVGGQIARLDMNICGPRMVIKFEFVGGRIQHLLMDWRDHFESRWLRDTDLYFIDERTLLGISRGSDSIPMLVLYDIPNVPQLTIRARYVLPADWIRHFVEFAKSASSKWNSRTSSNALILPSAEWNMLVLTAKFRPGPGHDQMWTCVPESLFKASPFRKGQTVAWRDWGTLCTPISNVSPHTYVLAGPYIVGSQMAYLEYAGKTKKLCVVDISPFYPLEASIDSSKGQSINQERERSRRAGHFRQSELQVSSRTEDIRITEDNIILILNDSNSHPTKRIVQIMQMGTSLKV